MAGKINKKEFKERNALCLDPDSGQFYLQELQDGSVRLINNIPESLKKSAKSEISNIKTLCQLEKVREKHGLTIQDAPYIEWNFNTNAVSKYRRRILPLYLLHKDLSKVPIFTCEENMSLALAVQYDEESGSPSLYSSIFLKIEITDYMLSDNDSLEGREFTKSTDNVPVIIELEVVLVASADAAIKQLIKEIYKNCKHKIHVHNNSNRFVLKCTGYNEYFTGVTPLLCYDKVRNCLRNKKAIDCVLTEVVKEVTYTSEFPPILFESKKIKSNDMEDELREINWAPYLSTPYLFWYPTQKLPHVDELNIDQPIENMVTKRFYQKASLSKPRAFIYKTMDRFLHKRKEFLKSKFLSLNNEKMYSGECDMPFRIKIHGLDNILGILKFFLANATDNGIVEPEYITLQNIYKKGEGEEGHEEDHHKKSKKNKEKKTLKTFPLEEEEDSYEYQFPENLNVHDDDIYEDFLNIKHATLWNKRSIPYRIYSEILGLPFVPYMMTCEVSLLYGINLLRKDLIAETLPVPFSNNPRWYQWIHFKNLYISQLPLETKIAVNIKIYGKEGQSLIIGCVQMDLFNEKGYFPNPFVSLKVWPFYKIDPRLSCMKEFEGLICKNNNLLDEKTLISFGFDTFTSPLNYSLRDQEIIDLLGMPNIKSAEEVKLTKTLDETPTYSELAHCSQLIKLDPLKWEFSEKERLVLLKCRYYTLTLSSTLPVFLSAINWADPDEVKIAYELIHKWTSIPPQDALCLLDAAFPNEMCRLFAVEQLASMSDDLLVLYMPELVMALMYESQHYSPLGEYLIERSLKNKTLVGHEFFWLIRSQLHLKASLERYMLMLETFVMLCGNYRTNLLYENTVNNFLFCVAKELSKECEEMSKNQKVAYAREKLEAHANGETAYNLPKIFAFPHDSRLNSKSFNYQKCKVMDSKKAPLWLEALSSQTQGLNFKIMFKAGDDLRQDILTLQLIRIMDKMWLDEGLDYKMKPYRVMATMDQVGFIEIVTESETVARIHVAYGGKVRGAFIENTIMKYLQEFNKTHNELDNAVECFKRSCAGYCVATYILGIGDRHSDNVMVSKEGHFFHIDFGHFLGNFKTKLGIKRERSSFLFQKEFGYVIGIKNQENYEDFLKRCTTAYNIIRRNANTLVNVFLMMISAGMPELQKKDNVKYLTDQLSLDLSEQEAAEKFKKELKNSLTDTWRTIDNFFHNIKRQQIEFQKQKCYKKKKIQSPYSNIFANKIFTINIWNETFLQRRCRKYSSQDVHSLKNIMKLMFITFVFQFSQSCSYILYKYQ